MKNTTLKLITKQDAVSYVNSGNRVFIQGAAMTPNTLIDALCERYSELDNVEIIQLHTEGTALYTEYPYNKAFKVNSCFVGANVRGAVNSINGDYIPIFLSEVHLLFKRQILPIDVAFIQVSPPDQHGFCSLGTSVDVTLSALEAAKIVIAQINPQVPRTHGDGIIHRRNIDYAIEVNTPLHFTTPGILSTIEEAIGQQVASLVDDGATLQMGIGNIPNAVLANLNHHKRLGIHTEMFSDGILPLIENGSITGEDKKVKQGKIVTCFAMGSQKLYDFVNDNPMVHFKEASYTNDTKLIRKNPKVTAINSAIEIDLTGQVCADTIGKYQYSGVGGQMDFIRGASLSEGGKAIIALPSITAKGFTKIVPFLKEGAGVTTTRAHVHYVVTENGIVDLFGKNLKQRAKALIEIAHPDYQETLEKEAFKRFENLV
ncbi:acetyl-CoA hydrolase/transferase family protein [Lacinutrix sp. Hel_I_90]|uniref:acetyl-CoA hydrolase/transferase family protein n=1 Tax=Lacinutrix sp. Hel_I_90 TaxID=1249999 RepID=UPI0005C8F6A8|nr:acetyl-CoA hydrolase/transferase C-terminal domain-containing protein [Lacinutrix sp. Hel_I_90]